MLLRRIYQFLMIYCCGVALLIFVKLTLNLSDYVIPGLPEIWQTGRAEFARYMDEAKSLARTDAAKRRVAVFEKDVWQHMLEGRRQWEQKHPGSR